MPVLSRLRLGSIGAPAARFDPLELEFVGEDLRLRHTLLSLRNGGGKSSFIGLVLLLLNPKVASSLGKTKKGDTKLETDYVQRGETGIVLAEWIPDRPEPGTPRRHVTFMAMQRGEREGPADKGFVAAALPMDVDPAEVFELVQLLPLGERTPDWSAHSVDALLRRARAVHKANPAWEVVAVPGHQPGRWLNHLRAIGLDPGMARLLARMNLEEGDLAKALTFSSAEQFVTQAARLLAPGEDVVRDLQRGLVAWAAEHRDQGEKRIACQELRRMKPLWEALVARGQQRRAARGRLQEAAFDALALYQGVELAQEQVVTEASEAREALVEAQASLGQAKEDLLSLEGEAVALETELSRLDLDAARAASAEAQQGEAKGEAESRAARAVLPLLQLARVEAKAGALRREQSEWQSEAAPRVRRRDSLALGLAIHAQSAAEAALARAQAAAARRLQAVQERQRSQAALDASKAESAGLRHAEEELSRRLGVAQAALDELRGAGRVMAGESLGAASSRLRAFADARVLAEQEAREALLEAQRSQERARAESRACQGRVERLATDLRVTEERIREAEEACEELSARVASAQIQGTNSFRLPEDGERLGETLRLRYRETVVRHAQASARKAAVEASCVSLRSNDVLPPPADAHRVLEAAGGSFQPALDYLRATLGDEAGAALRAVPALAHAVVAGSAAAFGRAQEALQRIELDVDAPVPVFVAGDLTPSAIEAAAQGSGPTPRLVVGLAPHASEEARGTLLARRVQESEAVGRLVQESEARAKELGQLSQRASEVLLEHGTSSQDALRERREDLDRSLRAAAEAKSAAIVQEREAQAGVSSCSEAARDADEARRQAERLAREVEQASARHGEVLDTAPSRLRDLAAERETAEQAATQATEIRDAADAASDEARSEEGRARQDRREAEERARRLESKASDRNTPPCELSSSGVLEAEAELEAVHRALVADAKGIEDSLVDLLTRAEELRRQARTSAGDEASLALARERIVPELSEADAMDAERAAEQELRRAAGAVGSARQAEETAKTRLLSANQALAELSGLAARVARGWALPPGVASLQEFAARLPERRQDAEQLLQESGQALIARERARVVAEALLKTWGRIVADAREAWETVRRIAPDLEPSVRSLVGPERNARAVIDPAAQATKLGEEATALRRTVSEHRDDFERAERSWLDAAREAMVAAEHSSSESVRRFATVRIPEQAEDGDPDAHRAAKARAVALRGVEDLEQLDREVEDLEAQLADVAKTRATLAQQLGEQVRQLASRIRDLERASILPDGLGAWSGQRFLRLELPLIADETQLQDALEATLSDWADRDAVPSLRDLLPESLGAGLSGPPRVLLPKADRFDRAPRRRPISQLAKDSGGEALTAAFILFCVLARVVSTGPGRERRSTLALIDNPLGAANRFDFVEAQCAVAAAFGVQYIAATGINDPAAIERFERLITLTNPGQDRVANTLTSDQALGRPIESALWARDQVLQASGGHERTWGSGRG